MPDLKKRKIIFWYNQLMPIHLINDSDINISFTNAYL